MSRETIFKYLMFLVIVLVGIGADQWTKMVAEDRLATVRPGHFEHHMVLQVPASLDGKTVSQLLDHELTRNSPEEREAIARSFVRSPEGLRLRGEDVIKAEQKVHLIRREITVVKDYWDFQYTRNPGAAFGFLADTNHPARTPFFIIVSAAALLIILYILKGVALRQQILIWGLSLIASGAMGNFIDRLRFGYVIDFILWKYTDQHRWPTFNVADALICIGVGLMMIEIVRDGLQQRKLEKQAALGEASDEAPAAHEAPAQEA